ncbi:11625_t:CDS:2 [Scutellospora calospora]|uniref:11625_t:CDS:1 n=1 Tax=Scutellospora calospora TaxID=85575 RepID=A0ACA9KEZ7_9GLOM|nr:11625_t:CDS:2 [Scutellospora calospora]
MTAEVVDYRVSRLVVLCKDCGHDVGLYPARHKCKIPEANISKQYLSPNSKQSTNSLWSKLKTVNNWKEMVEDDSVSPSRSTSGTKLWDKLLSAASSAYNGSIDGNSDNESEKDDWEGETHISRILREYHQQKNGDLPDWLYDPKPTSPQKEFPKNSIPPQINNLPSNRNFTEGYKNSLPYDSSPFTSNNSNRGRQPRISNQLPSRLYPPSNNGNNLSLKTSHQQLRVNPVEFYPSSRARSVSPNPPFRDWNGKQGVTKQSNQLFRANKQAGFF